jgi:N-methylhydantoinase B
VLSDRGVIPPWGVLKGGPGKPYHLSIERDGEQSDFATPGKVTGHPVFQDEVVVMRSSGGGGYGDPLERDPARVAADVDYGYVSREAARETYGVVLTDAGAVDEKATRAQRQQLASKRAYCSVVADDALEPYTGAKGKRRILALDPADAKVIGVKADDLVEIYGKNPAPLRAWVKIAEGDAGRVRLDAFGRRVLGVGDGDKVFIRFVPTPTVAKGLAVA